jgi:hypothetical protein
MLAVAAMPLTLKTINDELRRLGHDVHIEKGDGYFYVWKGEANNWLDRTIHTFHQRLPNRVVGYFEFDAGGSRKFISKVAFVETGSPK